MAKTKCIKFDPCYFSNTFFGPPAIVGRVLWSSICLSYLLSFCLSVDFLGIAWSGFFRFLHGARNPYEVVWQPDFPEIRENGPKMAKSMVFWIYWKIFSLIFSEFVLQWIFILFAVFLHKSRIWKNFISWDLGQNVLSQSDCRII